MKDFLQKEYEIYQGDNSLQALADFLMQNKYSSVFVLCDKNTFNFCLPKVHSILNQAIPITISAGELHKNLETCQMVWEKLLYHGADRKSLLICLGGGVVTDLGAFAAGNFKRGIDFIHIPTSLMGMTDAAIGGKSGIDFQGYKNAIGLFRHPKAIFIWPEFLITLPQREFMSGMAEVMKHALIADSQLWQQLIQFKSFDVENINALIPVSVNHKVAIVSKDPEEKSLRKLLNFGHTIGHAFESESLKNQTDPLLHGEAIAAGIICETRISQSKGYIDSRLAQEIYSMIRHYFPVRTEKFNTSSLLQWMKNDKKNDSGSISFVLLKGCGVAVYNEIVPENLIIEAIDFYYSL